VKEFVTEFDEDGVYVRYKTNVLVKELISETESKILPEPVPEPLGRVVEEPDMFILGVCSVLDVTVILRLPVLEDVCVIELLDDIVV
jgi:hypothetical protein